MFFQVGSYYILLFNLMYFKKVFVYLLFFHISFRDAVKKCFYSRLFIHKKSYFGDYLYFPH